MTIVVPAGPHLWWAWTGLRLEPEPAIAENGAHVGLPEAQRRSEAATLEQVWLAEHGHPDGRAFELRYANTPDGRITCALLCRAHGGSAEAAADTAHALRDALAATPRHVRAEPVGSPAELHPLLVPFAPESAVLTEVRKRLDWARLSRRDAGFPIGVTVASLAGRAVSWEPVWETLARQPVPTVIAVCLEPYAPPDGLPRYAGLLAQEYDRLARPGVPSPVFQTYVPPDPFAARAARMYRHALRFGSGRAYRMRITVAAGDGPPPTALARLLATTLAPGDAADDGAVATGAVVVPVTAAGREAAWAELTGLHLGRPDPGHQQGVPVPLGEWERLLAVLVDLPEATAAFRFPYEVPGRPPLFATRRRPAAPAAPAAAARSGAAPGDPNAPLFGAGDDS